MQTLSPSCVRSGQWYRLALAHDGALFLESISDRDCYSVSPAWAYCGEVPRQIANTLDATSPDSVSRVLDHAITAMVTKETTP